MKIKLINKQIKKRVYIIYDGTTNITVQQIIFQFNKTGKEIQNFFFLLEIKTRSNLVEIIIVKPMRSSDVLNAPTHRNRPADALN